MCLVKNQSLCVFVVYALEELRNGTSMLSNVGSDIGIPNYKMLF